MSKSNYGKLTQILPAKMIEATTECLSLSEPETWWIGMMGKVGAVEPPYSHWNSVEEAMEQKQSSG